MPGRLAIDFGTSNTVVAVWDETQQTVIPFHIPDYGSFYQQDNEKISVIPSQIHYASDNRRWLGKQAEQQNLSKSERTFRWMKRYISNHSPVKRKIDSKQISHVGRSRHLLRRLGKRKSSLYLCSWKLGDKLNAVTRISQSRVKIARSITNSYYL